MLILICDAFDPGLADKLARFGEVTDDMARLGEADVALIRSKTKATAGATSKPSCCWRSSSRSKQAAKVLIEVALECVAAVSARSTPASFDEPCDALITSMPAGPAAVSSGARPEAKAAPGSAMAIVSGAVMS